MTFKTVVVATIEEMSGQIPLLPSFFEAGLEILHLRSKALSQPQFQDVLKSIPPCWHSRLVVHDYYSLAEDYGLGGIHLTEKSKQADISASFFQRYAHLSVSASFHSLSDLESAYQPYRYVFLSPIFNSISKPGYLSQFPLQNLPSFLQGFKQRHSFSPPVLALGGVNLQHIAAIKEAGFDGAAVSGAIWTAPDPLASYLQIQQAISAIDTL
jgi:thiamine-phosphate pyrophosphorylase